MVGLSGRGAQGWDGAFDAVTCVGNSLAHAQERRAALTAMAGLLRPGGLLAVTSRNWERLLAESPGLDIVDRLVERGGRVGLVIRAWTLPHRLDVAVAVLGAAGDVETHAETLAFCPFTHEELDADLRGAGLEPQSSTYAPDVDRYLVTATTRRPWAGAGGGSARR
jgi:SAM-dependent methyltransferase